MHKGSVVAVDKGVFHLKRSLFSPISIQDDSTIFGLFYPSNLSEVDAKFTVKNDFMFTPVPPRMWFSAARFIFYLQHKPGTIEGVTKCLAKNNINILSAESTRSAHRFIYLTLTVEFEKLSESHNKFYINNNITNTELIRKQKLLRKLKKDAIKIINKECSEYLYVDKFGIEKFGGVECYIVNSLQYFYKIICKNINNEKYHPFEAVVNNSKIIVDSKLWNRLWSDELESDTPSYGFAATGSRDLNIRISIIPKSKLKHFYKMTIKYEKNSKKAINKSVLTTRGLLASITSKFHKYNYNIWYLHNSALVKDKYNETGYFEVIAQSMTQRRHTRVIHNEIVKEFGNDINDQGIVISEDDASTNKMTRFPIFLSIRNDDTSKEAYIKKLKRIGLAKHGLLDHDFISIENPKGQISHKVINGMKGCNGVIQIYNYTVGSPIHSPWLEAECLLAISLNIPVFRIINEHMEKAITVCREVPSINFNNNCVEDHHIEKALTSVIMAARGKLNRI
jgi:hypothetical protein